MIRPGWKIGWAHWTALGLIALTTVQQAAWVSASTAIETWDDDAGLYRLATCIEDGLRGNAADCFAGAPYPPLIPAIAGLHFYITGDRSLEMALHSLWMWPILLCVVLYAGLNQAAGRWAGLAGVALGPAIVWSLHIRGKFYTEVPLAALVTACVVCWVASDRYKNRLVSGLLGLFLGLGLLAKWSFAFFLAPPMALAWGIGLARPARSARARGLIAATAILAAAFVGLGASGTWPSGLIGGLILAGGLASALIWAWRRDASSFETDAPRRWVNVAIATGVLIAVAGPWYLTHLTGLQAFLADNLSHRFHGDPIAPLQGLPFYPAVLLTRVLGTPLALLLLLGVVRAVTRGRSPLAVWSLLALVSGTLILGVLPYRAGRYLIAGLGLATPLIALSVARPVRWARFAWAVLLVCGLLHQISWIPLRNGWLRVPHQWSVFTLPESDLFGNSHRGITDAAHDLVRPRWRFLPVASPPVSGKPATRRIIEAVNDHSAQHPFLTVIVDPASQVSVNALRTEVLAVRAPPTSKAVSGDIQPTTASIRHWWAQARHPPDTPEKVLHGATPRRLYIATVHRDNSSPAALDARLQSTGWQLLLQEAAGPDFSRIQFKVWAQPGGRR